MDLFIVRTVVTLEQFIFIMTALLIRDLILYNTETNFHFGVGMNVKTLFSKGLTSKLNYLLD